jgi:hypothetical protein
MSAVAESRRPCHIPLTTGPLSICILHRSRWHVTLIDKPYDMVVDVAQDAYRRSGLPVQIRDAAGTILLEVNDDSETVNEPTQAGRETHTW